MVNKINRRDFMAATASTGLILLPDRCLASMPVAGRQAPSFYRYRIGSFELTAVSDGVWNRPIDDKFVRNAFFPDVQNAMAESFLPTHILPTPFTALLVDTGKRRILIDTGSGGQITKTAGSLTANLCAAGFGPSDIDMILISNFHPDHVNGIKTKDDELVFPRAQINVPAPEWAYWMNDRNLPRDEGMIRSFFLNTRRVFNDIAKNVKRFQPGKEVAPGIVSVPAYGHTPGHTAYIISDGKESMFALCDVTNHPALFARHPEWQGIVDQDGPRAVETRRRILDRVVADDMLVQGYHFPFPGLGHIEKRGNGYEFVPAPWQSRL